MPAKGRFIKGCKERGEWAELCFMARAVQHGFNVSRPYGDAGAYDVGVEHKAGSHGCRSSPLRSFRGKVIPAIFARAGEPTTGGISNSSRSISCPSTCGTSFHLTW